MSQNTKQNEIVEILDAMILEDMAIDSYWGVDDGTGELVRVHESRYNRRDRKAERNARHAKIRKEGRNA